MDRKRSWLPPRLGSPAPYWLLVALKVLGFTLHIAMMHLWLAGLLLAMAMAERCQRARPQAERKAAQPAAGDHRAGYQLGYRPLFVSAAELLPGVLSGDNPHGVAWLGLLLLLLVVITVCICT